MSSQMALKAKKDRQLSSRKEAIGKRPWPNLPQQLLNLIARQPKLLLNISYPGTTKSWRSASKRCHSNGKSQWSQLSDIGAADWCERKKTTPCYVNIFFRQEHVWNYGRTPPEFWDNMWIHYVGCYQGVLLARGTRPSDYYIRDPATRIWWNLPLWDVNIPFKFVMLSASPYNPNCCVLVLTGHSTPAYAAYRLKKGEYKWLTQDCTIVDPCDSKQQFMKFGTAIAFEGKFYASSLQGALAVIEDIDCHLRITAISTSRAVLSISARHFKECLIESNGKILLIFLIYQKSITMVDQAEVFCLNIPKLRWLKIESLGDRTLFVEPECCIWVTASKVGCRHDCIYFTDRGTVDGWWMYDMKSGSITPGWNNDYTSKSPVWGEVTGE